MQFDGLRCQSAGTGGLHRLDARIKLVTALIFILILLATPFGAWTLLGIEGLLLAFVIGVAGIPPREVARRWLALFMLVGFLTLMVAPASPARATIWFVGRGGDDPDQKLARRAGHARLGRHDALARTALGDEQTRNAGRACRHASIYGQAPSCPDTRAEQDDDRAAGRTFNRRDSLAWGLLSGLIGLLFLRSFERSERVYGAMVARGWDGTIRSLHD